jgi:hypothetical protein
VVAQRYLNLGIGEISEVRRALQIHGDSGRSCLCGGDLTIEFQDLSGVYCSLGFHHHKLLRHPHWFTDANLEDGAALANLLAKKGITAPLLDLQRGLALIPDLEALREVRARWVSSSPRCISSNLSFFERHFGLCRVALCWFHRDPTERCRVLLRWLDSGTGQGFGQKIYDYHFLPKRLLDREDGRILRAAYLLSLGDLSVARGVAKYFLLHFRVAREERLKDAPLLAGLPGDVWEALVGSFDGDSNQNFYSKFLFWLKKHS